MTLTGNTSREHRVSGGDSRESGCSTIGNGGVSITSAPGHRVSGAVAKTKAGQHCCDMASAGSPACSRR